jgi:hypothetical protein
MRFFCKSPCWAYNLTHTSFPSRPGPFEQTPRETKFA